MVFDFPRCCTARAARISPTLCAGLRDPQKPEAMHMVCGTDMAISVTWRAFSIPMPVTKINHRAPHLSSRHLETVKVYRLQGSELSPRGEFGIDGECNENTHQFRSYAALRATLQKQETALRPATTKPRRVEA